MTTDRLYCSLCRDSAAIFQLKNTSVPCSPLLSRSSQGGCHLSYCVQSHVMHKVYTVYEQKYTTAKKKDLGTSVQWHKHSHNRNAHVHTHIHTLFPSSELIHCCYGNIKVIMHAVKGEKAREREKWRRWETENVMVWVQLWCN